MNLKLLKKHQKLMLGLLFDALGYVSFFIPVFDFVWAPLSAYLMTQMYAGKKGKIAGVIVFIEEALPFIDIVPTFSLMWSNNYYVIKKNVWVTNIIFENIWAQSETAFFSQRPKKSQTDQEANPKKPKEFDRILDLWQ